MTISLRRLAHSRYLRMMAVLAWLMLASTSLIAAPMSMGKDGAPQVVQSTSGHQHQGMARMQQVATPAPDMSCCNKHMVRGCGCHSVCGNVLSLVAVLTPFPVMFAVTYARLFDRRAPAPNTVPPLRPPSV